MVRLARIGFAAALLLYCWPQSHVVAAVTCGDGVCSSPSEDSGTCPQDCNPGCGNGVCETGQGESNFQCPSDCPCNADGWCDPGENSTWCPSDCPSSRGCTTDAECQSLGMGDFCDGGVCESDWDECLDAWWPCDPYDATSEPCCDQSYCEMAYSVCVPI